MMVTFISQCEKKALSHTRRVLDSYAGRIGDNTWQTVITDEGLRAVKKLLRKTASKNTAVSCHWIRSRSRSELVWVVGNKEKFSAEGAVPVNSTSHNLMQSQWENDWHYMPLIKSLAALAALLHDWGKASRLFQDKLRENSAKGDPIRHEWISCLLFHTYVHIDDNPGDEDWLQCLSQGVIEENRLKNIANANMQKPFAELPNAAALLSWLIVSHHRLPEAGNNKDHQGRSATSLEQLLKSVDVDWGYLNKRRDGESEKQYETRRKQCFEFPEGFISQSRPWIKQLKKWSQRLLDNLPLLEQTMLDGSWRLLLHHARLSLMLGDHYYSSQGADPKWQSDLALFANTNRKTRQFEQKLDEHLIGVMKAALKTCHLLPAFEKEAPQVNSVPSLKKKSPAQFAWQDKAANKIHKWRKQHTARQGCFIVNMAGTGCGKTMANAKIMRALSEDGESLRYILALGLRTLTLQTGDEYRDRIGLDDSELAVLIGSKAVMDLHKAAHRQDKSENFEHAGSESAQPLWDDDIDYDCNIPEEGLATVLTDLKTRRFLYAPVLACTIDHIMSATETKRGGRYILPCLRLMSSDLVIDEVDDFTGDDLIAIGRLVHLAGMLGRKVMISSATIPPDLAEGFFNAYREGWQIFCKFRNAEATVACGWVDEFNTVVDAVTDLQSDGANNAYRQCHHRFVTKRADKIKKQPARRKAEIIRCREMLEDQNHDAESKKQQYFDLCQQAMIEQHHKHHTMDDKTGVSVSFGVVRMANIEPCLELTDYLLTTQWPEGVEVRIMPYHSRQVMLLRHEQEKHLDAVLKRKEKPGEQPAALHNPVIRRHLDQCRQKHLMFILVATPVEEVGRDHDFDWAVVEPSSYRSIIQLAGRVKRHRDGAVDQANVALLQYNLRALRGDKKAFCRPGYESAFQLNTHDLTELLNVKSLSERLDATPRIVKPAKLDERDKLADLEHHATHDWLCSYEGKGPESLQGWLTGCWWLTALPQKMVTFRKGLPTIKLYLVCENDECYFAEKDADGKAYKNENMYAISQSRMEPEAAERLWLDRDYQALLEERAESEDVSTKYVSLKYGELAITDYGGNSTQGFVYNDQFGLRKQ